MFHLGFLAMRPTIPDPGTIPTETPSIVAIGAGTTAANGQYNWSPDDFSWVGTVSGYFVTWNFDHWEITTGPGATELYRNTGGDSSNVPKSGWTVILGDAPAPTLSILE